MKRGLVVGKFYPPHKGHHFLIDFAGERVDELDVLVCDHPSYHIPASLRADWLKQRHPKARVHIIPDIGKDDDSAAWAKHTAKFLGYTPDIVFSSEDYGDEYARLMDAKHHKVDKQRRQVPISATQIRADVLKHWQFLEPSIRANFAVRVCVLGAESTGTTTLSQALAKHYRTVWAPEYGRLYSEGLICTDHIWNSPEFSHIAKAQQDMENQLAGESNGLLICDTNAFATRLWHERYVGDMYTPVDQLAAQDKVDLYILTDVDIPFVDDGLRDGEHIRHSMHTRFIQELQNQPVPFVIVSGSVEERLKTCLPLIDKLIKEKVKI